MDKPYGKDMSNAKWEEVFGRQAKRAALIDEWLDALRLKAGDRVLDIGAGPGYVSLALAERVGPTGMVYALDRSAEALAYLEHQQTERDVRQIERIVADAAAFDPAGIDAGAALVTMVLHHTDDPAEILRQVASCMPEGAPVLIGEFNPDGPGKFGPPQDRRLSPDLVQSWCEQASLSVTDLRHQTPDHYMIIAECRDGQHIPGV
jgi:ubiquinone/menaquinone biosynthesis C-methylase UbiE